MVLLHQPIMRNVQLLPNLVSGAALQNLTLGGNAGVGESLSPGRGAKAGGDIPRD